MDNWLVVTPIAYNLVPYSEKTKFNGYATRILHIAVRWVQRIIFDAAGASEEKDGFNNICMYFL